MDVIDKRVYSGPNRVTSQVTNTDEGSSVFGPVTIPKGKQSTAWTKSTASTGSATLSTGHGIISDQIVDVYWEGGHRYNCTVGTVSGNTVPIVDSESEVSPGGDNLPATSTPIVIAPRVVIGGVVPSQVYSYVAAQFKFTNTVTTESILYIGAEETPKANVFIGSGIITTDDDPTILGVGDISSTSHVSNGNPTLDCQFTLVTLFNVVN